jgi:type I restriction enzyme S subunit
MTSEAHEPTALYLVKTEYRRTEIGVIPTDWDVKRLRDISPNQSVGLVINPSTYFDTKGTVPMLVGSNVAENRIDWNGARRISTASNERLPASRVYAGDLVTVRVGDPGVTAVIPREYSGSNCASMMIVRSHPSFDSTWLCHLMNSSYGRSRIESVQYGTAQKQFNISDAVDFQYPVPPLAEQRAIATALSDVDALIAGLERLITKKRDIKQAAMQQLLTGQTRLPGFSGEWVSARLGNVASLKNGYIFRSETYTLTADYKVITIANVQDGHMISESCNTVSTPPIDIQPHQELLIGDILISMTGNVGRVCRVSEQKCLLNQRVGKLEPRTVTSDFLFALLRQPAFMASMIGAAKGGAQPNLSASDINEHVFFMPKDLREQTAIAGVLADMDADLSAIESRLTKTRAIKQGMMQELLTGRIRLI